MVRIVLFWSLANNYAAVGDILPAVCGYIGLINEKNRVGGQVFLGKVLLILFCRTDRTVGGISGSSLVGGIPIICLFLSLILR